MEGIDRYPGETEDILKKIAEAGEEQDSRLLCLDILYNTYLREILSRSGLEWLKNKGFCSAPASTKYHGNYAGGLFDHSYRVATTLIRLTDKLNLKWDRPESPVIVGLLHDLCKIDQYEYDTDNNCYVYSNKATVKGHGTKSVIYIQQYLHIALTEEEVACILYHMGAFSPKEEWGDYTSAIHKYPNVLWTHTADMCASHIDNV